MIKAYKIVIECDDQGGYVATLPGVAGCQAQARSLKLLMELIGETLPLSPEGEEPAASPRESACRPPDGGRGL